MILEEFMAGKDAQFITDLVMRQSAHSDVGSLLDPILTHLSCVVGTIHRFDPATQQLELLAHRGIPDAILPQVRRIPIGKGMAGLAAQRRECVSVCNLQTDDSGAAKPAAKLTGMEGSIAVPMLVDGELRGVLGVAKPTAYEFTESEKKLLLQVASLIGERL
jgi:putative methionine-R-sulfoxide reductase with GAF domain